MHASKCVTGVFLHLQKKQRKAVLWSPLPQMGERKTGAPAGRRNACFIWISSEGLGFMGLGFRV